MLPKTLVDERKTGDICKIFQMLSDYKRLRIVLELIKGELCVSELTGICGGEQSTVSHQLRVLRDNKIVSARRIGRTVKYAIADEHVRLIVETAICHTSCKVEK